VGCGLSKAHIHPEVLVSHGNARTVFHGRLLIVQRHRAGWPQAQIAKAMGISRKCVKTWIDRYAAEGEAGLRDRSSRPHHSPTGTSAQVEARVVELRQPPTVSGLWTALQQQHTTGLVCQGLRRVSRSRQFVQPPPTPSKVSPFSRSGTSARVLVCRRTAHIGVRAPGRRRVGPPPRPPPAEVGLRRVVAVTGAGVDLLLIPLILAGVFIMPFAMAWLEPEPKNSPRHRATEGGTPPA
jgi:hypothetical protein